MRSPLLRNAGLAFLLASILSCGGSGNDPVAGGGIGGTGSTASLTRGTITGFGSVFVSGKEYETTNALITIDGQSGASLDNLKEGMVVLVEGSVTEQYDQNEPAKRSANTIVYESTVEGLVDRVATNGLPMVVLGQTVLVNETTIIDTSIQDRDIRQLHSGDHVQISGYVRGNGTIFATYVQRQVGPMQYHVKGFVMNHDVVAKRFTIGSLTVDYTSADISQLTIPTVSNTWQGLFVDVAGTAYLNKGSGLQAGVLTASKIEPDGVNTDDNILDAEVEAFVTQVGSKGNFVLETVQVQTTPETVFESGVTNNIRVGVKLDVEGQLVDNVLIATLVTFDDDTQVESDIATVNDEKNSLTLVGFPELAVQVTSQTLFQQEHNQTRLEVFPPGTHVTIRGSSTTDNNIVATLVTSRSPNTQVILQGAVNSAVNPHLVVLGIPVDTTSIPDDQFRGVHGNSISRSAFFSAISKGEVVRLHGTIRGSTVSWISGELKS